MIDVPEGFKPHLARLVWDMVDHSILMDPEMQAKFGLSPASPDVTEMEHEAADDRIARIYPLYTQICLESAIAGQVAHAGMLNSSDSSLSEEIDPYVLAKLFGVASFAIVAGLVDNGLLIPNFPEVHFHG